MRKGLLLVVALLAMSGLMAAMAFNTATITNAASLTVTATDSALVALIPGTGVGNKDAAAFVDDGVLKINLAKGRCNGLFGFQRNSTYKWDELFKIRNNSNETIKIRISQDGWDRWEFDVELGAVKDHNRFVFYGGEGAETLGWPGHGGGHGLTLQPGEEANVYLEIETHDDADIGADRATITVHAEAVAGFGGGR